MNEGIDFSDIPELGDEFFENAVVRAPLTQKDSVLIDHEIFEWFKNQGPGYTQRINLLLRQYMEQQSTSPTQVNTS
jgi:uncharacterized protein (DUF4415 family)